MEIYSDEIAYPDEVQCDESLGVRNEFVDSTQTNSARHPTA